MLAGKLSQLVQKTMEILETERVSAKPMKIILIRHKISQYQTTDTGSSWVATDEPFEKTDWSSFVFGLQKQIANLPIFKEIVEIMVKDYTEVFKKVSADANKRSQAEFWLESFVKHVLHEKLENTLTDFRLHESITTFENELNCSALEYKTSSYVKGVYLKADSVQLDENTTARKIKADDLEFEYYPFTSSMSPRLDTMHPSAVVEISMRAKDESEIQKKLDRIILVLRLFRLGSVHSIWKNNIKTSVIWTTGAYSTLSDSGFTELHNYVIEENEAIAFQKFYQTVEPLVQSERVDENTSLLTAITRYSNALLDPVDIERKLMTAMMALESLYSMPSDKGEIGYRISLRVAKLLSFLDFKPTEVRKNVEKSYYVRSKVAHGLIVDEKKVGKVAGLLNILLEYLRLSLIAFIVIHPSQKNRFVASIDSSLIDATCAIEIKNQVVKIAEQIPDFPISS